MRMRSQPSPASLWRILLTSLPPVFAWPTHAVICTPSRLQLELMTSTHWPHAFVPTGYRPPWMPPRTPSDYSREEVRLILGDTGVWPGHRQPPQQSATVKQQLGPKTSATVGHMASSRSACSSANASSGRRNATSTNASAATPAARTEASRAAPVTAPMEPKCVKASEAEIRSRAREQAEVARRAKGRKAPPPQGARFGTGTQPTALRALVSSAVTPPGTIGAYPSTQAPKNGNSMLGAASMPRKAGTAMGATERRPEPPKRPSSRGLLNRLYTSVAPGSPRTSKAAVAPAR